MELAREMARQSVVLLKNERNILPLDPAIRSIDYGIGWGNDTGKPATCGEGYDCADLGLSGVQEDLLERILQAGKPVVVLSFFLSGMG